MFLSYKSGKIFFQVEGKGTSVVLLHGFLESSAMWHKMAAILAKTNRVVVIDLPGHGQTDCFGYVHTMAEMAEAVYAVLRKLRLRKVILIGHSMGGYVSLAFAKKYPKMLKGLCLFHSTALPDTDERKKLRNRAIDLVKKNKGLYISETIPNLFASDFRNHHKAEIQFAKSLAMKTSVQAIIAALEGMKIRPSSESTLKMLQIPVAFIAGKKDTGIPIESIQKQLNLPVVSYNLILDEVAHMGHAEDFDSCIKFLKWFIRVCMKS